MTIRNGMPSTRPVDDFLQPRIYDDGAPGRWARCIISSVIFLPVEGKGDMNREGRPDGEWRGFRIGLERDVDNPRVTGWYFDEWTWWAEDATSDNIERIFGKKISGSGDEA